MTNWLEVNIETVSTEDGMAAELVIGALLTAGVLGVQTLDDYELRLFLENNKDQWDYADEALLGAVKGKAILRFYVEEESAPEQISLVRLALERLKRGEFGNNLGSLEISTSAVAEGWEENWKKYYKPFRVGKNFIVRPEWEEYEAKATDIVLSLNPGQVFGTGLHQTTRMCMEALEKIGCAGKKVLDLGCGSGILSVSALLLGAASAAAVDTDRAAARVAAENAAQNGVSLTMFTGNILTDNSLLESLGQGYDIILANIVADVVIEMVPFARDLAAPGGVLISSGIISSRIDEVTECFGENGFKEVEILRLDEWAAVTGKL